MTMSGSAKVEENNDVYFEKRSPSPSTDAYITVTGNFDNTPAARLTMDNDSGYTEGRMVVKGSDSYQFKNGDENKFLITSQTSQNWTTELDIVNNEIKLKKKTP